MQTIIKHHHNDLFSHIQLLIEGIKQRKKTPVSIAFSGGSTPIAMFQWWTKNISPSFWDNTLFFQVDERCVPPEHEESNFGMFYSLFAKPVGLKEEQIFRMRGELDPIQEALDYETQITQLPQNNQTPVFDIILLGMGDDGHTASMFPGNKEIWTTTRLCETAQHPTSGQRRLTLTGHVLCEAENTCFLVTGEGKAEMVKNIIHANTPQPTLPADYVNRNGKNIIWLLDKEAAKLLKK